MDLSRPLEYVAIPSMNCIAVFLASSAKCYGDVWSPVHEADAALWYGVLGLAENCYNCSCWVSVPLLLG